MQRRHSQACLSGATRQDQSQWAQTKTQEVPSELQETLFLLLSTIEHWHKLPKEVVESPYMEMIKSPLAMVLGNWLASGVEPDDIQRFLQAQSFCDFVKCNVEFAMDISGG